MCEAQRDESEYTTLAGVEDVSRMEECGMEGGGERGEEKRKGEGGREGSGGGGVRRRSGRECVWGHLK